MCRIMLNSASKDLIFGFRNRSEKLQQIQTLSNEIEKNEREIINKECKIVEIDKKIEKAEKIIAAHEQVIKDTEALIDAVQKNIDTGKELMVCYKTFIANNESKNKNNSIDDNTTPTPEERIISTTAYQKAKQDLVDLNLNLKTNKQLTKIVEKKLPITTDQSVDDFKSSRMTAYNILNDCFNNFRLKYLSSMRWF